MSAQREAAATAAAAGDSPDAGPAGGADTELLWLCAAFVRRADARTAEGDRLDDLPWGKDVDAGYLELVRGAGDHQDLLRRILALAPRTTRGLVAKARAIGRHQQDPDAEPIPAGVLADDVVRVLGSPVDEDGAARVPRDGRWRPGSGTDERR